jgi:hypothetical protein
VKYEDGKEYGWLSGFGWVEFGWPNIITYAEDMYENGNKTGIMSGDYNTAPRRAAPIVYYANRRTAIHRRSDRAEQ